MPQTYIAHCGSQVADKRSAGDPCHLGKASELVSEVDVEEKFILIYRDYQGALGFDFVLVFLPSFLSYMYTVIYTHMFI